jgi:hypothetical protein
MKNFIFFITIFLAACGNNTKQVSKEQISDTSTTPAVVTERKDTNAATAPTTQSIDETTASNNTIVPGKNIGKIEIGMSDTTLEPLLGKPDASDAAMGKAWLTWYGKKPDEHNNKTQLNVYTSYRDTTMRDKSVQQIRTTSSFFKTAQGVHVYASLDDIKKVFPGIKRVQQSANDAKRFIMYDDVNNGIAFEIVNANGQQICRAIFIHVKGKGVRDIYIDPPSNE